MSDVGKLVPAAAGDLSYLSGHIQTMDGRFAIALEGNPNDRDQNRPSHRITTPARDRSSHTDRRGLAQDQQSMGLTPASCFSPSRLIIPSVRSPSTSRRFEDPSTGEWNIVWRRRTSRATTTA